MNRDAKGVPSMSDLALSPAPNEVGGKLIKGPLFLLSIYLSIYLYIYIYIYI